MIIKYDQTGLLSDLKENILNLENDDSIKAILVFSCDANNFSKSELDPLLKSLKKPIFGGIFPQVIHQNKKYDKGSVVAGLGKPVETYIVDGLSDENQDYEEILDRKIPDSDDKKTMFVFVDGLSDRISSFIDSLFNIFGLDINYIGGGAGSLSFEQKPVLFTNDGLIQDAAIIAFTDIESGIGVNHGWTDLSGPYKVTESEGTKIKSLDWKPAFQVYREVIEKTSGKTFNDENFFDIAKGYPFGISKLGAEKIVRDPLALGDNESMICVGEVPENVFVHILSGDTNSLVNAAGKALSLAKENSGAASDKTTIIIDCISRVLFLEENFSKELEAVSQEGVPMIGALTLGEIANSGKEYLEFYNKTCVIGVVG